VGWCDAHPFAHDDVIMILASVQKIPANHVTGRASDEQPERDVAPAGSDDAARWPLPQESPVQHHRHTPAGVHPGTAHSTAGRRIQDAQHAR
jgi:hypothetical protein